MMIKQLQSALAVAVALALVGTAAAQPCVGKRCARLDGVDDGGVATGNCPATADGSAPPTCGCLGVTCGATCQGCECSAACTGAGCAFGCKGLRCGEGCGGADCAFGSTGDRSATGCNGAKCGFGCNGIACAGGCLGESCGHTCVGDRCGDGCVGAVCAHTCTGFQCARNCAGSYCNTNCVGDQCGCNDAPGSLSRCWHPDPTWVSGPNSGTLYAVYAEWVEDPAVNGGVGQWKPSGNPTDRVGYVNGAAQQTPVAFPADWPLAEALNAVSDLGLATPASVDASGLVTPAVPGYTWLELVAAQPLWVNNPDWNTGRVGHTENNFHNLLDCTA